MKKLFFSIVFLVGLNSAGFGNPIAGFWKSMNEETGKPQFVAAVYEYQNKYFARIIGTYNEQGNMDDTIYQPKGRAPGVLGNPYYCGLDMIWNLKDRDERYKGKIVDPEEGKIYNAEVWVEKGKLIVRGELLFFGRNLTWLPTSPADFPKNFKMPDVKKFIPWIPEVD